MLNVRIKTPDIPNTTVVCELTATPNDLFEEQDINVSGAQVNVNGTILAPRELSKSFADLAADIGGIADGETVSLTAIVKSDGAAE